MTTGPDLDALRPGDPIPALRISVDAVQQFFFSAAEWLGHRIHYDHPWATSVEGHDAIVISTTLLEATMHRMLAAWGGPSTWVNRLSLQNHARVYPQEELIFKAEVLEVKQEGGRRPIDLKLSLERTDGAVVMSGTATVTVRS